MDRPRDASGYPTQHQGSGLDRSRLLAALELVGRYLDEQGVTTTATTIGGAVDTIYLQTRQRTNDVDFFLENGNSAQHNIIHQAARNAARQSQAPLGANWLNNATQLFLTAETRRNLSTAAIAQGTIVHEFRGQRGGIVVYAAPWSYAFCGKLNRLSDTDRRPYDLNDAVVYLNQYLTMSGQGTVSARRVHQWGQEYRKTVTGAVLAEVDDLYYQTYGRHGIDLNS